MTKLKIRIEQKDVRPDPRDQEIQKCLYFSPEKTVNCGNGAADHDDQVEQKDEVKEFVSSRGTRHFPLFELKPFLPTVLIAAQLAPLSLPRLTRANVHPFLRVAVGKKMRQNWSFGDKSEDFWTR